MTRIRLLTLAALALLPVSAFAQTQSWEADAAHSHVGFKVRHMMVANVKGEFAKYTVKVQTDPKDLTKSTVEVSIDVASITTGNAQRDTHLKSADFFDAAKFPAITFKSKKIVKAGKNGFKVTGDLTIKDKTKQVVLDIKDFVGPVKDPWGNQKLGFSGAAKIDRRDFGLTWNKALEAGGVVVANDVNIVLDLELGPPAKK